MEQIIGYQPPENPVAILLHELDYLDIFHISKQLVVILLSAAKTLIAIHWKSPDPPPPQQALWASKVWQHMVMDKIADRLEQAENPQYYSCFLGKGGSFLKIFTLK